MHAIRLLKGNVLKALLVAAAAVLVGFLLALLSTERAAKAAFPGENGRIAFSLRTGVAEADIWTTNPDGTGGSPLTVNAAGNYDPAWSADGAKIAFSSNRTTGTGVDNPTGDIEIFTMSESGTNVTQLTFNTWDDRNPAWSPSGSKIAFEGVGAGSFGDNDIYVMNSDGSGLTNLTNTPGDTWDERESEASPDWSPDGSKIAFSSWHPPFGSETLTADLYVMNADGSGRVQLTNTSETWSSLDADWSPDGSKIAFTSQAYFRAAERGPYWFITVMNSDGSGRVDLTDTPLEGAAGGDQDPAWSPNGRKIAFVHRSPGVFVPEIYTMNADGSNQSSITNTPTIGEFPDWQPLPPPTYSFRGFFAPVDNLPIRNVVKAGAAVPVKFSLGGDEGLDVFADGYPTSRRIDCSSSAPLDAIEQTTSAGGSTLSYDPTTERYTYAWKSRGVWSGTCRQLVVKLDDGSVHRANFKFR
jgi:Tol biopolymer transport system component